MAVVVIEPPRPLVTAADIPGVHAGDDPFVTAMIAAAQAAIDGPTGSHGLAIGVQVLEWTWEPDCTDRLCDLVLPYGPILELVEVSYQPAADVWLPADPVAWTYQPNGFLVPPLGWAGAGQRLRVRYRAGFASKSPQGEWVPKPPPNAVAAVMLAAQHLKSLGGQNLFLRSESSEGVGQTTWTVSDVAALTIERATRNLMAPLKVFT